MSEILIGVHAFAGEIGAVLFVWVLVELISPTESRLRRARIVALLATIALFFSWIIGGFYYVEIYGAVVKPLIKEGPQPWAHLVITETKEHVFLFLPFLSLLTFGLISSYSQKILEDKKFRVAVISLCALIIFIAFAMAGMGYLISSGFRSALEVQVI